MKIQKLEIPDNAMAIQAIVDENGKMYPIVKLEDFALYESNKLYGGHVSIVNDKMISSNRIDKVKLTVLWTYEKLPLTNNHLHL